MSRLQNATTLALAVAATTIAPTLVVPAPAQAADTAPVVVNVGTPDIRHADDESPGRDWYRLIYVQNGAESVARAVVDDSEPVHHDGALQLSTPTADGELDIRYAVDSPVVGDDRPASALPNLADLAEASFAVKVVSGVAPTFVVDYSCSGVRRHMPVGDRSTQYVAAVPADGQWHTVDLGDAVWSGPAGPQTLAQLVSVCPKSMLASYGFLQSGAGADALVDDVAVGGLTTNFWVPPLERLAGSDRRRTACAMAGHYFDDHEDLIAWPPDYGPNPSRPGHVARSAVLVGDLQFADALAAGPLAALVDGPLLLNHGSTLATTCDAWTLGTGDTIYLVGGTGVIPSSVESALRSRGLDVVRLAGPDRYQTAVAVAKAIDGLRPANLDPRVFLASGTDFPDALSSGAPAGHVQGAVLLTQGARMAPATAAYLATQPSATVYAIGGQAAQAADLPADDELVGANRYETATMVADRFFPEATSAAVASGVRFPDAVSAAAYGGNVGLPVILVGPDGIPTTVFHYARAHRDTLRGSVLLGGTEAVNRLVFDLLSSELTPPR